MVYSYGCWQPESKLYVYRMTQDGRELSNSELVKRCAELGVLPVQYITCLVYDGDKDKLTAIVDSLLEGPSYVDNKHIREGVCIRVEHEFGIRIYKAKSWIFNCLEGIVKDDNSYIDLEEVA